MNSVKHFTSIPFYCFHYPNPQRKIPGPLQFIQSLRLRALLPFTSEFSAAVGDMQSFLASSLKKNMPNLNRFQARREGVGRDFC